MKRNGKILAGAAVILTLGSAAAVAHRHGGWHHKGPHGWGGPMGMMGIGGPLCRGNAAERADLMLVKLEYKVKPTDAQKPAFDDLKTAVKSAAAKVAAACPPSRTGPLSRAKAANLRSRTSRLDLPIRRRNCPLLSMALRSFVRQPRSFTLRSMRRRKKPFRTMGQRGKWGRHDGQFERRGEREPDGQRGGPGQGPASDDGAPEREGDL